MRLFFCVELEKPVRDALTGIAARLKGRLGAGVKWVARDNLHITVRFLGEVEDSLAEGLAEVGGEVARATAPFSFPLTGLGAFPTPRRARVIWAGPGEPSPPFAQLARRVEAGVQALGFPPERKEAVAHITLARLKPPRDVAAALSEIAVPELEVEVHSLTLMRSRLTPQGPIYTPLRRWELEG